MDLPVVKVLYIVKQMNNLTAYDTFNEETFTGPTQETNYAWGFTTEHEAMAFYAKGKASLKFAGSPGMYYTHPVALSLEGKDTRAVECKTEDEAYYKILMPTKRRICWKCDGKGTHVNPSIDGHGLTREDFDEDPDFKEAYMRGDYDIQCTTCKGEKVISVAVLPKGWPDNIKDDWRRMREEKMAAEREEYLERGIHS